MDPHEWTRISLEAPVAVAREFRGISGQLPMSRGGKLKLSGAAALALWNALPENIRHTLIMVATRAESDPAILMDRDTIMGEVAKDIIEMMHERAEELVEPKAAPAERYFIDRLLDPGLLGQLHTTMQRRSA